MFDGFTRQQIKTEEATINLVRGGRGYPILNAVALGFIGLILSTAGTLATRNRGPEFGPK